MKERTEIREIGEILNDFWQESAENPGARDARTTAGWEPALPDDHAWSDMIGRGAGTNRLGAGLKICIAWIGFPGLRKSWAFW